MRRRRRHSPLVIPPRKHQFAAFHGDCIKCEKRIGGNGGMQLRAEDFAAVVGAFERFDDVARNFLAGIVETEAGLHGMLDQGADLDDLAAFRAGGHAYPPRAHAAHSPHSDVTTSMSAAADQNAPSLSTPTARDCSATATLTPCPP